MRHMTGSAVRAAIIDRRIPFEPAPDELPVCRACLAGDFCDDTGGPAPVTLDLDTFRHRFDLQQET